jgi:sodium/potassium-transporting ATPase subunit alpha
MQPYELDREALYRKFQTKAEGLSSKEAEHRLADFGPNEIERGRKKSYLIAYLRQYVQFFAVLLEVASLLAFIADHYVPDQGNDILGYAIIIAVIINATFTFWQEYKADRSMEALLSLMPTMVTLLREGSRLTIDAKGLVPGDIILLEEGDKIAADAVLTEQTTLTSIPLPLTENLNLQDGRSKRKIVQQEPWMQKTWSLQGLLSFQAVGGLLSLPQDWRRNSARSRH